MKELLSRWQFGTTITYHFLFVPLTIGLALLVAVMQVLAYRRRDEIWDRLARFFGTLFLINFAMGIVTANAWMQHPVGYRIVGNKAELTDFWRCSGTRHCGPSSRTRCWPPS
jgi:cytochrome bd-type quinol oxidase subunit 1